MAKKHPANRLLEYLTQDDQLESEINSIETDADFLALSEMSSEQLDAELNDVEADLADKISCAQRMLGWTALRRLKAQNRHSRNIQRRPAYNLKFRRIIEKGKTSLAILAVALFALLFTGEYFLYSQVREDERRSERLLADMRSYAPRDKQPSQSFDERFGYIHTQLNKLNSRVAVLEATMNELSYLTLLPDGAFSWYSLNLKTLSGLGGRIGHQSKGRPALVTGSLAVYALDCNSLAAKFWKASLSGDETPFYVCSSTLPYGLASAYK